MCVVLSWLPGRFVDRRLTSRHLREVGALTARLHNHAVNWRAPAGFERGRLDNLYGKPPPITNREARRRRRDRDDETEALAAIAKVRPDADVAGCRELIARYRAAQTDIGFGRTSYGLVHGDIHQENYLFDASGIGLIDFDDCGFGHHLYDTAVTLLELSFREKFPAMRDAYLDGYRSVRRFPERHERHLDTFMRYRDLQIMLWAIELRGHPLWRTRWREEVDAVMAGINGYLAVKA